MMLKTPSGKKKKVKVENIDKISEILEIYVLATTTNYDLDFK